MTDATVLAVYALTASIVAMTAAVSALAKVSGRRRRRRRGPHTGDDGANR